MIDVYASAGAGLHSILIMLQEVRYGYSLRPIEQFSADRFSNELVRTHSETAAIVVDHDVRDRQKNSLVVPGTGGILYYLLEKTGAFNLLGWEVKSRVEVMKWLMLRMSTFGPALQQLEHFTSTVSNDTVAKTHYRTEVAALLQLLECRLRDARFLAGRDYSLADVATFPWVLQALKHGAGDPDLPNLMRWCAAVQARPAVQRADLRLEDELAAPTAKAPRAQRGTRADRYRRL